MGALGHHRAERLDICPNMFEHSAVVETKVHQRLRDVLQVVAEGLDCARSLPELHANDIHAIGSFSCTKDDVVGSSSAGASSS